MVVFDHVLTTWERIDDRKYAVVEEPLDSLGILHLGPNEAELLEQAIGNKAGRPIEVTLFPRSLDPARVDAQAARSAMWR